MKSCVEWRKGFKYLPEIDQFNIAYKKKEAKLLQFLDLYGISQRVNILLPDEYNSGDIDFLVEIGKLNKYKIAISTPRVDIQVAERCKENNIPFYFQFIAVTWELLDSFLRIGVSDVFVGEQLGFDLKRVRKKADQYNAQVRCYCNVSQSSFFANGFFTRGINSFFIRPEDMDIYDEYIDIVEFWKSEDKQNILYEIYFKDKKWDGRLDQIIQGLDSTVNNYYILGREFAEGRLDCYKNCIKDNRCHLCFSIENLAKAIEESPDYEVYRR